ncbi:MAG: hypothetical protein ACE5OY_05200 [Candidatus Bathyarchaeia archaeon]
MIQEEIEEIKEQLTSVMSRLEALERRSSMNTLSILRLFALPDHLRRTAAVVVRLGQATASQVANECSRHRSLESTHLNELVRLGHAEKIRRGREIFYRMRYVTARGGENSCP